MCCCCISISSLPIPNNDPFILTNVPLLSTMLPNHPFLLLQIIAIGICSPLGDAKYSNHCHCWPNTNLQCFCSSGLICCHRRHNSHFSKSSTAASSTAAEGKVILWGTVLTTRNSLPQHVHSGGITFPTNAKCASQVRECILLMLLSIPCYFLCFFLLPTSSCPTENMQWFNNPVGRRWLATPQVFIFISDAAPSLRLCNKPDLCKSLHRCEDYANPWPDPTCCYFVKMIGISSHPSCFSSQLATTWDSARRWGSSLLRIYRSLHFWDPLGSSCEQAPHSSHKPPGLCCHDVGQARDREGWQKAAAKRAPSNWWAQTFATERFMHLLYTVALLHKMGFGCRGHWAITAVPPVWCQEWVDHKSLRWRRHLASIDGLTLISNIMRRPELKDINSGKPIREPFCFQLDKVHWAFCAYPACAHLQVLIVGGEEIIFQSQFLKNTFENQQQITIHIKGSSTNSSACKGWGYFKNVNKTVPFSKHLDAPHLKKKVSKWSTGSMPTKTPISSGFVPFALFSISFNHPHGAHTNPGRHEYLGGQVKSSQSASHPAHSAATSSLGISTAAAPLFPKPPFAEGLVAESESSHSGIR